MMASGCYSLDELLLVVTLYPDTNPYSIEGKYFFTINQIESTVKGWTEMVTRLRGGKDSNT